jgi:toxin ParE1/3/4
MARYRVSLLAQEDLRQILAVSARRWGDDARKRYARNLSAAMRRVAAKPDGPNTHNRDELLTGLRSFHIRHVRDRGLSTTVREPVHVLYYLAVEHELVEIVRVLHERMEPVRYIGELSGRGD